MLPFVTLSRVTKRLLPAALAIVVTALFGACGNGADSGGTRACAPGDVRSCTCATGSGTQTCDAVGSAYGACVCNSPDGGPADADADASGGDADAASLLPFLSPCTTDAECETGLCHPFPSKGSHCTKTCTDAADCPAPSPGCNAMGVCRLP